LAILSLDEPKHRYRLGRVSCAKKAVAFFRISRSSRRFRFSRRRRHQLLALLGGEAVLAPAGVQIGLLDPVAQRLGRDAQVLGHVGQIAAALTNEPDGLRPVLRWIGLGTSSARSTSFIRDLSSQVLRCPPKRVNSTRGEDTLVDLQHPKDGPPVLWVERPSCLLIL